MNKEGWNRLIVRVNLRENRSFIITGVRISHGGSVGQISVNLTSVDVETLVRRQGLLGGTQLLAQGRGVLASYEGG